MTSDKPPSCGQPRKRAWPPSESQLEKVAFTHSSHKRVSVTQQWQGQLVRPRPPRLHNRTRTSCRQPVTTPSPPHPQKTRNQRNANAILSSNMKINRLQSFLVRRRTPLTLQRPKTSSLLHQSSPKPTSILTWRIRSSKPLKCMSAVQITSLCVSNLLTSTRLDTQGLLDRVFPLSEDQPESSCSLRTLLQDSSSHSLRALRVRTVPTPGSSRI